MTQIKSKQIGDLTSTITNRINATSIDALSDVNTSSVAPTNGQALVWESSSSQWKPATLSSASGSYLISSTTSSGTINVETAFDGGEAEYVVICNGASTVLIPYPVTGNLYKKMIVKNFSNSAVTIDTSSSGAIFIYDGTSKVDSITMPAGYPGFSTTLYRIGNDWVVV